jgi:predicted RNA binding protein YcfA (HicA-like mRNA interferase family)
MGNRYNETIKLLKESGCSFKRQAKGSHELWYSPITNQSITVPKTSKSRHTYDAILKQAGIKKK